MDDHMKHKNVRVDILPSRHSLVRSRGWRVSWLQRTFAGIRCITGIRCLTGIRWKIFSRFDDMVASRLGWLRADWGKRDLLSTTGAGHPDLTRVTASFARFLRRNREIREWG